MERTQLILFMKAAELQHFTKAAEALNVSQPYLSNSISELESELGVRLFDRVGRGIRLNKYGQTLYKYAAQLICVEKDMLNELHEMQDEERTNLSVATNASIYMPWLCRYTIDAIPEISMHLFLSPQDVLYKSLDRGEIDFAILGPEVRSGYNSEMLIADSGIVAWPDGHWLENYDEIEFEAILDEVFIGIRTGYAMREYLDKYLPEEQLRIKSFFETFDTNSALQFVKTGVGIAMAPASTIVLDPYFMNHYTRVTDVPCGTVYLVWRKDQYIDSVSQCFIKTTKDFFKKLDDKTKQLMK